MNYCNVVMLLILSHLSTIYAMKRRSDVLYPPYQPTQEALPRPKKQLWQSPDLLKHGIYVATVENTSEQSFRILSAALEPDEGEQSVAFCTSDEKKAVEVEEVPHGPGMLFSKSSYVEPKVILGDKSRVEGAYLRIEQIENPAIKRILWIVRQIDDTSRTCTVDSYFHDAHQKKFIQQMRLDSLAHKIITRVHLVINDPSLGDIKATTSTFACRR